MEKAVLAVRKATETFAAALRERSRGGSAQHDAITRWEDGTKAMAKLFLETAQRGRKNRYLEETYRCYSAALAGAANLLEATMESKPDGSALEGNFALSANMAAEACKQAVAMARREHLYILASQLDQSILEDHHVRIESELTKVMRSVMGGLNQEATVSDHAGLFRRAAYLSTSARRLDLVLPKFFNLVHHHFRKLGEPLLIGGPDHNEQGLDQQTAWEQSDDDRDQEESSSAKADAGDGHFQKMQEMVSLRSGRLQSVSLHTGLSMGDAGSGLLELFRAMLDKADESDLMDQLRGRVSDGASAMQTFLGAERYSEAIMSFADLWDEIVYLYQLPETFPLLEYVSQGPEASDSRRESLLESQLITSRLTKYRSGAALQALASTQHRTNGTAGTDGANMGILAGSRRLGPNRSDMARYGPETPDGSIGMASYLESRAATSKSAHDAAQEPNAASLVGSGRDSACIDESRTGIFEAHVPIHGSVPEILEALAVLQQECRSIMSPAVKAKSVYCARTGRESEPEQKGPTFKMDVEVSALFRADKASEVISKWLDASSTDSSFVNRPPLPEVKERTVPSRLSSESSSSARR